MTPRRLSVWPPLPLDAYARAPSAPLPFPLEDKRCRLFALGRHALWHGLEQVGLGPSDEVLVPAYHHGSEVEVMSRRGLGIKFYEASESLEPSEDELERLLTPSVRALHLIHYLGFPQDAWRWRRWCDEHRLLLIEDAAQAWLASSNARPLGSFGDLAIFCLYKSVGLPEGALLVSRAPPRAPEVDQRYGASELFRRHGAWLAQRSEAIAAMAAPLARSTGQYDPMRDFALGRPNDGPYSCIPALIPRLANESVAAARRAHYSILLEELGDLVPPPFDDLPRGASPFAFPLEAPDKVGLLERLSRHGINALDVWSVPHPALPVEDFPAAARRRNSVVALPVHQELDGQDLERMIGTARARRPHRPELRLEPIGGLEEVREEWTELASRAGNVFSTWEWCATWWGRFGRGRRLLLSGCKRPDGELAAIVPVYQATTGPLRVGRLLGHGVGDQLGPVCAPEDRTAVARAIKRAMADGDLPVELLLAEGLPADEGWSALLGGRVLRHESARVLTLTGAWEKFLATRSSNLREKVRRSERVLSRDHELAFRLVDDPAELQGGLDALFQLHDARWRGKEVDAFAGPVGEFHQGFAAVALDRGWLRLWLAEIDGSPVAAWLGFRYEGSEAYYQSGRDPGWDRYSVGFVLLVHSIREAFADGMREYRFLRGDEPYKARFAAEDIGLQAVVVGRGPASRTLATAASALSRPAATRALLSKFAAATDRLG